MAPMLAMTVPTALLGHVDHAHSAAPPGGPGAPFLLLAVLPFLVGAALVLRSKDAGTSTVVLFSAAAGFVHAMVTPQHFQEDVAVGVFTLAVTLGQMGLVVVGLNRPSRPLWLAAAAGNAAVLAIWALSRTTGLPVGPEPWAAEGVGLIDLACSAYEVAIVAGCLKLATTGARIAQPGERLAAIGGHGALASL
jgi:hypothetical protein